MCLSNSICTFTLICDWHSIWSHFGQKGKTFCFLCSICTFDFDLLNTSINFFSESHWHLFQEPKPKKIPQQAQKPIPQKPTPMPQKTIQNSQPAATTKNSLTQLEGILLQQKRDYAIFKQSGNSQEVRNMLLKIRDTKKKIAIIQGHGAQVNTPKKTFQNPVSGNNGAQEPISKSEWRNFNVDFSLRIYVVFYLMALKQFWCL